MPFDNVDMRDRIYLVGDLWPLGRARTLGEEKEARCHNEEQRDDDSLQVSHTEHQDLQSSESVLKYGQVEVRRS